MALATYSARGIQINLRSTILPQLVKGYRVSGYGPDEFLTIETEDDDWTTEEGADGFVVRSAMPNVIANIQLTLQQTSPTNKVLTGLYNIGKGLDPVAGIGADVFTLDIRNPLTPFNVNEPSIFNSPSAYISKIAPMNYAKESGVRVWEITAVDGKFTENLTTAIANATVQSARQAVSFAETFKI